MKLHSYSTGTTDPSALARCAGILALVAAGALVACERSPTTFDDCILDAAASAASDVAMRAATAACRRKFPEPEPEEPPVRGLSIGEREELVGTARYVGHEAFLRVYNGNQNMSVCRLVIGILSRSGGEQPRLYEPLAHIPPLSTASVNFRIVENAAEVENWELRDAYGISAEPGDPAPSQGGNCRP